MSNSCNSVEDSEDSVQQSSGDSEYYLQEEQFEEDLECTQNSFSQDQTPVKGKRKREPQQRIDNEQTKKLRNRVQIQHSQSESEEEEEEEGIDGVERVVMRMDAVKGQIEVDKIRNMWQLASIQDFLALLQSIDLWNSKTEFTLDELEEALVYSEGFGLLAKLHMDIISGISPKSQVNEDNWVPYMVAQVKLYEECPFRPAKGKETAEYALLSASDRIICLLLLCNTRIECEDFRSQVDNLVRSTSTSKKNGTVSSMLTLDSYRRQPLGHDHQGNAYYFIDLEGIGAGVRMYRENAVSLNGKQQKKPPNLNWEWLGGSIESIKKLGETLACSEYEEDIALAEQILESIVVALEEREENKRKQSKRAKRLQLDLNNIIIGEGRRTRTRKNVDYTFTHVFHEIDRAIRQNNGHREILNETENISKKRVRGVVQQRNDYVKVQINQQEIEADDYEDQSEDIKADDDYEDQSEDMKVDDDCEDQFENKKAVKSHLDIVQQLSNKLGQEQRVSVAQQVHDSRCSTDRGIEQEKYVQNSHDNIELSTDSSQKQQSEVNGVASSKQQNEAIVDLFKKNQSANLKAVAVQIQDCETTIGPNHQVVSALMQNEDGTS